MKIKTFLPILISSFVMATSGFAADLYGQAGDIAQGQPYQLSKGDTASYYKEGKVGAISFNCKMEGEGSPIAVLYPGKNFAGNMPHHLNTGANGPYTWTFKRSNADVGNIKIKLIKGDSANVSCKEIA